MTLKICEKRRRILETAGHTLVTGGPGSGKTTVALLKALHRIETGLEGGQCVLFLSFSRQAVARIIEVAKKEIPIDRKFVNIQTYHSFFWEILRTHGYLLGCPRRLTVLLPYDERAMSDGISRDHPSWKRWEAERERLFREEGLVAFDLFAPKAAELLRRSSRIVSMISDRYPLIIVDEAQDTGPDQWACVKALAGHSPTLCLADLDQQIFDFLPGIGPERIQEIEADLKPTRIDLGGENNRNADSEIAAFGYDILSGTTRNGSYRGVSQINFHWSANQRDLKIRQSIGIIKATVKKETGQAPENIAMLASYDRGAIMISNALRGGKNPIEHKILFDETSTLLSSRFLAFLMEPKSAANESSDLAQALELLSQIFRANGSATALRRSKEMLLWTQETRAGKVPSRSSLYRKLGSVLRDLQEVNFCGDPRKDWVLVRRMLRDTRVPELLRVDQDLEYLIAFNRGKRIASGLSSMWENRGDYSFARQVLDEALAQDQILSGIEDLSGIHVMTMHKSKGKQFDAVIIFRCEHSSPFVWRNDPEPYRKSRKVLRVAITRARFHTLILSQAFPGCPILSQHKLS